MPSRTLFYNARVYAKDRPHDGGWVLIDAGCISDLGWGAPPLATGGDEIDVEGHILAPGLIDIHVHGALGYDTMDATPEALEQMARFYAQHGVTAFLATTMSGPSRSIIAALRNIAEVMRVGTGGAELLGAHVEGPYLDVEKRGCQDPAHVRPADPLEYHAMFDTGAVKLITLAPESPENQALIRYAIDQGAAVAIGHTRASYDAVCCAVELGATQVTHLFNGMEPLHHRRPGAVGAALTLDSLRCQLIADNVHVHPAVLKLAVSIKGPERIILVTDAMRGTGMPDGEYSLGGLAVTVRGGVARIASGALAGSTLTLERALSNIMAAAELSLLEALSMATSSPALALRLEERKGAIAIGMDADLIVLDAEVKVLLTMVGGRVTYRRPSTTEDGHTSAPT